MSETAFPGHLNQEDPDLSERQRRVFLALVGLHGEWARPVGSESITRESDLGISPASIRHALADLEAMGLVERAHASAGRVPSGRGYEFFVRVLLRPALLSPEALDEVERRLRHSTRDVEHLLNEASRLLSALTRQLGLALASTLDSDRLAALDLAPLDERRALLVLNLGVNAVRTLLLELDSPLDRAELEEVAGVLRERLVGRPLSEVRERLREDPGLARVSAVRIVARAADASWARPVATPLFSAGAMHIAEQPEFADGRDLGSLLRVVETGSPLDRLMMGGVEGQVGVRVGLDEDAALAGCSLVSFPLPGAVPGAVAVLGPRRMDYARVLAAVDAVGVRVTQLLQS